MGGYFGSFIGRLNSPIFANAKRPYIYNGINIKYVNSNFDLVGLFWGY